MPRVNWANWDLVEHFTSDEFACKCCGKSDMDFDFVYMLDLARKVAKTPMRVSSGYRCPKHDAAVGGRGNHTTGMAVDIVVPDSLSRFKFVSAFILVGFRRIGIGSNFIHVDSVDTKTPNVMWLY